MEHYTGAPRTEKSRLLDEFTRVTGYHRKSAVRLLSGVSQHDPRHAPKRDANAILLLLPCSERVPPLTLRLITRCLRLRSAALFSGDTSGPQ